MTSIGPAFGFITGSFMLRIYVDFNTLSKGELRARVHEKERKDFLCVITLVKEWKWKKCVWFPAVDMMSC